MRNITSVFGSDRRSRYACLRTSVHLFGLSLSWAHNLCLFGSNRSSRCHFVCPSGTNLSKGLSLSSVSGLSQVSSRSVSGLKALLTHFVIQSEPKILRLVFNEGFPYLTLTWPWPGPWPELDKNEMGICTLHWVVYCWRYILNFRW